MQDKIKLLFAITFSLALLIPNTSFSLKSDFRSSSKRWMLIISEGHTGVQKTLTLDNKNDNEKIFLYWMDPESTSTIQSHEKFEEVAIVTGSLYWLNENNTIQKILKVGDYVNRQPGIKHGPFKAGPKGCLMFVRLH